MRTGTYGATQSGSSPRDRHFGSEGLMLFGGIVSAAEHLLDAKQTHHARLAKVVEKLSKTERKKGYGEGARSQKMCKNDSKLEAMDPRNLCFYTGGVTKITKSKKQKRNKPNITRKYCYVPDCSVRLLLLLWSLSEFILCRFVFFSFSKIFKNWLVVIKKRLYRVV